MTELLFNWMASHSHRTRCKADERMLAMKGLLLGMMCCMAAGAEAFVLIPDGPLSLQQQFVFGLIMGTIGTIVGCATFDAPNVKSLARQAVANLGLAALLAPSLAAAVSKTSGIPITVTLLAPIAGLLGIGGSVIFAKVWPMIVAASEKKASKGIKFVVGDDDTQG